MPKSYGSKDRGRRDDRRDDRRREDRREDRGRRRDSRERSERRQKKGEKKEEDHFIPQPKGLSAAKWPCARAVQGFLWER